MHADLSAGASEEFATLGGGCFWCLEAVFQEVRGVNRIVSGYAGGHVKNPSYRAVCAGSTGHAEVVQIAYNPQEVSYRQLLEIFFTIHDPTTLNRQGADVGTQYRSIVLHHSEEQKRITHAVMADLTAAGLWTDPIVTEVAPIGNFYPAEAYHQDYYRNNTNQPYCQVVIAPKVAKFRQKHLTQLRAP